MIEDSLKCLIILEQLLYFFVDSDYQLGSAAQTPGLNNSIHAVEFGNGAQPQSHSTPLAEAFISRSPQGYAAQPVS